MAKGTATTTVRDLGEARIRRLIEQMKKAPGGPHVKVGILEGAGMHLSNGATPQVQTVVEVAVANEFGSENVPERAFMRVSEKELRPVMAQLGGKLLADVIAGRKSLDQALDELGLKVQAGIKKKLMDGPWAPNAPSTIARKGSDRPLVDTGQLRDSIQYVKVK